jgi:hypothetical protein
MHRQARRRAPDGGGMTYINPLANSVLQSTVTQQQQAGEKTRQIRRSQAAARNVAVQNDTLEHQVESSVGADPIHDEEARRQDQKKQSRKEGEDDSTDETRLDVKA